MALLAAFIGIDRHLDVRIRDLVGAKRDATALWALFCDTIPEIQAELLTDTNATLENVHRALDRTLGVASPEDTVILSFSGHGTHDHRLVTYNTSLEGLSGTTLTMDELARRIKETRAKAVLCILDCCFSGQAPARVLEDSPIPRDPGISLEALAGKGRLLIAASNVNEFAFELPARRHGLLTVALLDVLQAGEGVVSLPSALDRVTERVRVEADRMGLQQTPVWFGYIEGGLAIPVLRPGNRFFEAFPEARGVRIGSSLEELTAFRIPQAVITEWKNRFQGGLNNLQLQAVNDGRILDGSSLLVIAPTSSGKTFIGEMAATKAIIDGRKAVFLLPYRALVNEKYDDFSRLYERALGFRVIRCTGDYLDQTEPFVRGKYDLAVLTYEMFLNLTSANPATLNQLGLVVLDEAQFITDPVRGITVELLLTFLLAARQRGIAPQVITLSAVIGDINSFDEWLGAGKLISAERPVPLVEGVLDRNGVFQFKDASGNVRTTQLLPQEAIQVRRDKPSAQDVIVPLLHTLIRRNHNEKVIVFRNQRGPAEGCAGYLSAELGLPPATAALAALPRYDLSSTSAALRACLNGGTAFHNSNMTRDERVVVERAFRDPHGGIRVLAATTTVAAGINTPASTVLLAEQEFIGEDGRAFTVAEYKNMAGRAGRLGMNEQGTAMILAETGYDRERLFNHYVLGTVEPLRSSFSPEQLETWVIRLLAQVKQVSRPDVVHLLLNTYGGYLANRAHLGWREEMKERLEALLARMLTLGLIDQEQGHVQLTLLGQACGRSALSFASAMRLVEVLRAMDPQYVSVEGLMAVVQALPESDGGYTPLMRKGQRETIRPREAAQRYGTEIVRVLQRHVSDEFDYYARCKRATILWDWVHGEPIESIEQRYSTTAFQGRIGYGDVRRFVDATRFHLRAAHQIAAILFIDKGPSGESTEALLKRLEVGIPAEALDLLLIPLPLSRGEYLALYQAGIKTAEAFWALPASSIEQILGKSRETETSKLRPNVAEAARKT